MSTKEKLLISVSHNTKKLERGDLMTPNVYVELAIAMMCSPNNFN